MIDHTRKILKTIRDIDYSKRFIKENEELQNYHIEDQKSIKNVLKGDGMLNKSIQPIINDNSVNWKITIKDNQSRDFDVILSNQNPSGFEISTNSYLITEESLPLFRKLIIYKQDWLQTWDIRLNNL